MPTDEELKKEYYIEFFRELARLEASFADNRITNKEKMNRRLKFLYSLLLSLVSASIGFWMSYMIR